MNRMFAMAVALFLAVAGISLMSGENAAQAGHGCRGCSCRGCYGCDCYGCYGYGRHYRACCADDCCDTCNGCAVTPEASSPGDEPPAAPAAPAPSASAPRVKAHVVSARIRSR
ncbi:MAG TPA: hypothetical protein VHC19_18200 [Pirellulales bacterium]|nr:hypothetical protein [Pirellulales bacterium]